jgi:hypothetical protein
VKRGRNGFDERKGYEGCTVYEVKRRNMMGGQNIKEGEGI